MHCENARDALLERLDRPLDGPGTRALETHLEDCGECRALATDLADLGAQARVWHELTPPPWNPTAGLQADPPAPPAAWYATVTTWFPTLASAAALLLAVTVFLRDGAAPELPPAAASMGTGPTVEQLLAATREERRQELQALTTLLKAEMDRRSVETEQSLKYVISHQIQSQQALESIRSRLEPAAPITSERL
jgi:hypothetical protein